MVNVTIKKSRHYSVFECYGKVTSRKPSYLTYIYTKRYIWINQTKSGSKNVKSCMPVAAC
ncbi:hypothetical protein HanRHA438_Chr17g0834001 [Helianthus annuus]|nr:hypothetical protein HanRHA438_Chr17g0834001 [Helianthus annuus]